MKSLVLNAGFGSRVRAAPWNIRNACSKSHLTKRSIHVSVDSLLMLESMMLLSQLDIAMARS